MILTRRRLLKTLSTSGVVLVSAGCIDQMKSEPNDTSTDTPAGTDAQTATPPSDRGRRVPMGRTVTVGDTQITVENPRVRKAVVTKGMAHTRVVAHTGQFVLVDVLIDGAQPDEMADRDLWSSVDGDQLSGSDPLSSLKGKPSSYAFTFPAERHDKAAILHMADKSRIYWTLPSAVRDTLALEPKFSIPTLQVQNRGGQLVLEMTVANEGERDGTFKTRVSLEGFSGGSIIQFPISANESHTYTGRPGDILTYVQNQGGGTLTVQYPTAEGLTTIERVIQPSQTTTDSNT